MSKKTYADLLAYSKKLEAKVALLERTLTAADRHRVYFHVHDWVSIPLHHAQKHAVQEWVTEHIQYDDYKQVEDERHYEEIVECDVLPEFRHLLVRYTTTLEGDLIATPKVWGLIQV